ncbi:hypothetical protein SAMN04487819_10357 [Actinopolyspora alba]|uniref:DUF305 domain-containing protein n=1 Tax=Actinopolyspora alba TaxID=673379 RepID=A0A1I1VA00_9ACTN|nr:hypothetical protein SAMN04487819_10357 [Actinopolyspora alba]
MTVDFPPRIGRDAPAGNVDRRTLLRLSALATLSPVLLSCSGSAEPDPDPLVELAETARADAELARATAESHPDLAESARLVANAREEHAGELRREIDRLTGGGSTTTSTAPAERQGTAAGSEQAAERLRAALREAQRQAARTVPELSGYRAGLAGSVSAGCAGLREVVA